MSLTPKPKKSKRGKVETISVPNMTRSERIHRAMTILTDPISLTMDYSGKRHLGGVHITRRSETGFSMTISQWKSFSSHSIEQIEEELKKNGMRLRSWGVKKLEVNFDIVFTE